MSAMLELKNSAVLPGTFTAEQEERARTLDERIRGNLSWLDSAKGEADHRIASIGGDLQAIAEGELYRVLGFSSINRYMRERVSKFERLGVTQLYACKMVAEQLAGHVTPAEIEEMGITNAHALANAKRWTGRVPGREVVEAAKTQSTDEFKRTVALAFDFTETEKPKGKWFPFDGFFAEPEEIKEIERAIECAKATDPVIRPGNSDSEQRKEVMLRFACEYLATYEEAQTPAHEGRITKGDMA